MSNKSWAVTSKLFQGFLSVPHSTFKEEEVTLLLDSIQTGTLLSGVLQSKQERS